MDNRPTPPQPVSYNVSLTPTARGIFEHFSRFEFFLLSSARGQAFGFSPKSEFALPFFPAKSHERKG